MVETSLIDGERRAASWSPTELKLSQVLMAWLSPTILTGGDLEARLLAHILGGSRSSRLYRRLVHDERIASDATARQSPMALASVFRISATARPGVSAETLDAAIDDELRRIRTEDPSAEELARAVIRLETDAARDVETVGGRAGRPGTSTISGAIGATRGDGDRPKLRSIWPVRNLRRFARETCSGRRRGSWSMACRARR